MIEPARHYAWLDPLRAFAAVSVIIYHLAALAALQLPVWYPAAWFRLGFLGVDLFFAISGAVILQSLAKLRQTSPGSWRQRYVMRRLARIVPLYLLTGFLFVLLVRPDTLARDDAVFVVLAHLLFVQNLFPSTHGVINGPSWSLGVEMQFYMVMLLLGPWFLRLRWQALLAFGLVLGVSWRTAVWWWARDLPPGEDHRVVIAATQLPGVFDTFVAGMLAWRWSRGRRTREQAPHARGVAWLGLASLLAWSLAITWMHLRGADYWQHPASVIAIRCVIALAAGLSVATALEASSVKPGARVLRASGDVSYGLYLWHMGVLLGFQAMLPGLASLPFAALVLLVTLALSVLSWIGLERPLLRYARAAEVRREAGASAPKTPVR